MTTRRSGYRGAAVPDDAPTVSSNIPNQLGGTGAKKTGAKEDHTHPAAPTGAPVDATYLTATANGTLTNEVVVGSAPGGELGGTWASPTVDAVHSGSAHQTPPSFATPAIALDSSAAAGAAGTVIRSDSTIVAFDATSPTTQAFGDTATVGSAAFAARRDHLHGMPANPAGGTGTGFRFAYSTGANDWFAGDLIDGILAVTGSFGLEHTTAMIVTQNITIDKLMIACTAAFSGGTSVYLARLGIYNTTSATNYYPGALRYDAGTVDISTTTGVKSITLGAAQTLAPGFYWLTCKITGTGTFGSVTGYVAGSGGAGKHSLLAFDGTQANGGTFTGASPRGFRRTGIAAGALPDPFTASLTYDVGNNALVIVGYHVSTVNS